jgi:exodeoxyribonuclease VII large subunit
VAPLFAQPESQRDVWTVTQVTGYIRELFEIDYRLREIQIAGEISNLSRARSGHLYFTLKDAQAQLPCVMWRNDALRLRYQPGDGDAVIVSGQISVYEAGGRYQLYATSITPAGRGDLAAAFEELKRRLEAEGLFDEGQKQPLPVFPRKIGVVTSIDAAALRDILNVLRRRFPIVQVLIAPTAVQGIDAPPQIVRALQWLDGRDDIDTIIIARGGGSLEDLWAFNDERVARAIFGARHPVISGVGHETDFSIADFVADVRAPTPSVAAELAVPDSRQLKTDILSLQGRQQELMRIRLAQERWQLTGLLRNLKLLGPQRRLLNDRQRVDTLAVHLDQAMRHHLVRVRGRLQLLQTRLSAVSPEGTLARGYAIVRDSQGRILRSAARVQAGDKLQIQVSDGAFGAQVIPDDN